jgi:hypothetical protein
VADAKEGEDDCPYTVEHWFAERPGIETVAGLFEEAKRDFATLYPGVDAENFSVEVRRARDQGRLAAEPNQ